MKRKRSSIRTVGLRVVAENVPYSLVVKGGIGPRKNAVAGFLKFLHNWQLSLYPIVYEFSISCGKKTPTRVVVLCTAESILS